MSDLFADLDNDDDDMWPTSSSTTTTSAASAASMAGMAASSASSTTTTTTSGGGAGAWPHAAAGDDLPAWLSRKQAGSDSFAVASAAPTRPFPSRKRSGDHVTDLMPDPSPAPSRAGPIMSSLVTLTPELADAYDMAAVERNSALVVELTTAVQQLGGTLEQVRVALVNAPVPLASDSPLAATVTGAAQLAQWANARHAQLLDDVLLSSAELAHLHVLGYELRVLALQLGIYENELRTLVTGTVQPDALTCLVIAQQPFPISVKQNKPVSQPTVLRVLKAARSVVRPLGAAVADVVTASSKAKKQQPVTVEGAHAALDEVALTATFGALSFPVGSRLKPVALKFSLQVELGGIGGGQALALESDVSGELIVKTNENQWDETEGTLLLRATWPSADARVSWARFCNVLQRHYVVATRQQVNEPVRALGPADFNYIHKVKFDPTATQVTQKDFKRVWEWFGPYMHRIRYQRHLCPLWHKGMLFGFIDRAQAEALLLSTERVGAFLLRFSERVAGQFAVSYLVRSIETSQLVVRHYLIKDSDTAGAKKTLPDFLREYKEFAIIVQLQRDQSTGRRFATLVDKHSALEEYYSKKTESAFDGYEDAIVLN